MSKHTPGPWTQFDDGSQSEVLDRIVGPIKNVSSHMTATVARASFGIRSNEEVAANARLIAAAPDLLHEAEKSLGFVKHTLEFFGWAQFPSLEGEVRKLEASLTAAIAKATGN